MKRITTDGAIKVTDKIREKVLNLRKEIKEKRRDMSEDDFVELYSHAFNWFSGNDADYHECWKILVRQINAMILDCKMLDRQMNKYVWVELDDDFFRGKVGDVIERLGQYDKRARIGVCDGRVEIEGREDESKDDWYKRVGKYLSDYAVMAQNRREENERLRKEREKLMARLGEIDEKLGLKNK